MPVYPCRNCRKSVDPTIDAFCKACNEPFPFECSKCTKKMNQESIFELAGITFQKPLFCLDCGDDNKVIECRVCGKTLIKSQGKVTHAGGIDRVYHPDCFAKQVKITDMITRYVTPVLALAGAVLGYAYGGAILLPIGLIAGAAMCIGVARLLAPK